MNQKQLILSSALLFYTLCLFAQEGNRALRIKTAPTSTRAVIIGISDYEDDQIPDLRFAHKDAEAFAEYLSSPAGGGLSEDLVKLYTNENATGGNIHKALYWLVKESKKNDNCIIYFSGHGDVETIYEDEPGHFLAYDSPSSIYQINSLRIDDLKRIITTLSNKNGAKVVVYTDACRAGKLAGSEINGTQATTAALANQFSNEIKIMSCQANEFSIEGEQWGGGRGIFSYHLIDGLVGMADVDDNKLVDLKELRRYLEDRFDEELEELNQTPIIVGDKNSSISIVDDESLLMLKSERNPSSEGKIKPEPEMIVAARNVEDDLISAFYLAIKENRLLNDLEADSVDLTSAESYYQLILNDPNYADKLPIVKGDFISSLQDGAQKAINMYLKLDPGEIENRMYGNILDFRNHWKCMKKAVELLGETHYLYPQFKAKEIYFEVLYQRLKLDHDKADGTQFVALGPVLQKALTYQERSPFIYNELGILNLRVNKFVEAQLYFDKTIEMSPTWAMPFNNKCNVYLKEKKFERSVEYALKALDLNWKLEFPYFNLANILQLKLDKEIEIDFDFDKIDNPKVLSRIYDKLARNYILEKRNEEAEIYLDKASEIDPEYNYPYFSYGYLKMKESNYSEALQFFKQAHELGLKSAVLYSNIGLCYNQLSDDEKAIEYYNKALELNPKHKARLYLAMLHLKNSEAKMAQVNFEKYINGMVINDGYVFFDYACSFALLNDLESFKNNMQKAIAVGFVNKKEMEESKHLSSIKSSFEYKYILDLID